MSDETLGQSARRIVTEMNSLLREIGLDSEQIDPDMLIDELFYAPTAPPDDDEPTA